MLKKEFAKIGKHIMRQLSNAVETYEIIEEQIPGVTEGASQIITKTIVKHTRLSKKQIQQFMLFHFYHVDERGVIRGVSEKDIAEDLNCTIRTVRNNNVALESAGLICHSRSGEFINIMIYDYKRYFEESGYGYLEINIDRFEEIILIDNVNALRLELRKELVYDNNEAKRIYKKDASPCKISFNDFKTFAPKYTHYKRMLKSIVKKGTSAFKTIVQGSHIYFDLKDGSKYGKGLKKRKKEEYRNSIVSTVKSCLKECKFEEFVFEQKDIDDFIQLAFEYSLNRVLVALEILIFKEFYEGTYSSIFSYGGKLRTIIRQQISNELTEPAPVEFIA